MKLIAVLLCAMLIFACALPCTAQDSGSQETASAKKKDKAAADGMAYGAILVAIIIMIVLPSAALLLITKVVGVGVEEIGLVRCVYSSLIFFAATGLVFYYFAQDLEKAIASPVEFFNDTNLLIGLCISFVIAFVLIHFVLGGTLLRSIIAALLFLAGFYGSAYLAYSIIVGAGAEGMLKGGLNG